ncbi:hypothetical protein CEW46_28675, partial [Bacillus cereus]
FNAKNGEYSIVDEILSSTKLRLKSATNDTYLISKNARLYKINPVENITIDGIRFLGQGRIGDGNQGGDIGVCFTYGRHITVKNCEFINIDEVQLEFRSCYQFLAENNYHSHTKYFSPSGGVGESKPTALVNRGTVQYQVRTSDCCQYGTIRDCVGEGGRHFYNCGHSIRINDGTIERDPQGNAIQTKKLFGINRHIKVINCYSKNTWHAGFSTHCDGQYLEFINCTSENSGTAGFNPRTKNIKILNCTAINCKTGYMITDYPQDIEIIGCRAFNCKAYCNFITTDANQATLDFKSITIKDCYFKDGVEGIFFNIGQGTISEGINISNNIIKNTVNTGNYSPIRLIGALTANIENNKIDNTTIGYQIRLEGVTRVIVKDNMCSRGYRTFTALNTCATVVTMNNTFTTHQISTIDNSATSPTNQGNLIL